MDGYRGYDEPLEHTLDDPFVYGVGNRRRPRSERQCIDPSSLCVGCIVWLPAKDIFNAGVSCSCDDCYHPVELDDAGYNHPVVIVRIGSYQDPASVEDVECDVACVTTFNDMDLGTYYIERTVRPLVRASIPIMNTSTHGLSLDFLDTYVGDVVRLEDGAMHKQSYIRLKHIYRVRISSLRMVRKGEAETSWSLRLGEPDYSVLMRELGLPLETYPRTAAVALLTPRRPAALTGTNGWGHESFHGSDVYQNTALRSEQPRRKAEKSLDPFAHKPSLEKGNALMIPPAPQPHGESVDQETLSRKAAFFCGIIFGLLFCQCIPADLQSVCNFMMVFILLYLLFTRIELIDLE